MNLETALLQLATGKKSKRLQYLWPQIEARLASGVSHAQILTALNECGLELTERTYKSYLYRYRRRRRISAARPESSRSLEPSAPSVVDVSFPASTQWQAGQTDRRPPTFDYDPRGISPELLK